MSDKISPQTSSEPAVAGGAGIGNKSSDGFGKPGKRIVPQKMKCTKNALQTPPLEK
jgi:hypothetical protein